MEFRDAIKQRWATKMFEDRKVPDELVDQLLEAVRLAPSGLNIQPWRIKVITDPDLKARLSPAAWDEPQIKSCSHLLVFCADTDYPGLVEKLLAGMKANHVPDKVYDIVKGIAEEMGHMPPEDWFAYSQGNVCIAISYALLAAKDLGFDSCPMTHFKPAEFAEILELPANLVPVMLCPLGYAAHEAPPKWRYPVQDLLV
jgi:nitroreductase